MKTISALALAAASLLAGAAAAQPATWHGPPDAKPAPAAQPPAAVLRRYEPPTVQGLVVDQCESWSTNCGGGGAHAFCRLRGYERASKWELVKPGRTWVLGSNRSCEGEGCVGFTYVVCADPR
jgi:hypothetical protein